MIFRSDGLERVSRVHRTRKKNCTRWMQEPDEIVPISPPDHSELLDLLVTAAISAASTLAMAVLWWYCG